MQELEHAINDSFLSTLKDNLTSKWSTAYTIKEKNVFSPEISSIPFVAAVSFAIFFTR